MPPVKKIAIVDDDSDLDPDDLLPVYLECKTKLFHKQIPIGRKSASKRKQKPISSGSDDGPTDLESAKLLRKIKKIEDDVLFDQYLADQQWQAKRIQLEKEAAASRNTVKASQDTSDSPEPEASNSDDEVSKEAAKIGAELLAEGGDSSDDDTTLADLFASLPVNEIDPLTGKSSTVVNGKDGVKVTIRDFGKWAGVNPTRVLEEACRAR